jgi:head-tail adaptor
MLSALHEGIVNAVRIHPEGLADVLGEAVGIKVPDHRRAWMEPADVKAPAPTEWRADGVVVFADDGSPTLAVVVEVQLRPDPRKRWTWPVYVVDVRIRRQCPVVLLVLCVDATTAAWCAEPIELGPGSVVKPAVANAFAIPKITEPGFRFSPHMAVLSTLMNAYHPDIDQMVEALVPILATIDPDQAAEYAETVAMGLQDSASALKYWEDLMGTKTFEFQSRYAQRLRAEFRAELRDEVRAEVRAEVRDEAKAEFRAEVLLRVLAVRGIDVPDDVRTRITECTDPDQIGTWVDRAATAISIDDLFA